MVKWIKGLIIGATITSILFTNFDFKVLLAIGYLTWFVAECFDWSDVDVEVKR